jgi:hypothetical protein
MNTVRAILWGLLLGSMAAIQSCTINEVSGIEPVYPAIGGVSSIFPTVVDSLQPELKWQQAYDGQRKYDLAIWDTLWTGSMRKIIYQKTGLTGTVHKVEIKLSPGREYYWSIRETGKATWTRVHSAAGYGRTTGMFKFKTPG